MGERYLKMYKYSPSGRTKEFAGRSAGHNDHHQDLQQGADGQQHHRVHIAHRLDQSGANGEEGARQKREEDPVPPGALPIGIAIIGELLGVVIGRMDAVIGCSGFYAELHCDSTHTTRRKGEERRQACRMIDSARAV